MLGRVDSSYVSFADDRAGGLSQIRHGLPAAHFDPLTIVTAQPLARRLVGEGIQRSSVAVPRTVARRSNPPVTRLASNRPTSRLKSGAFLNKEKL